MCVVVLSTSGLDVMCRKQRWRPKCSSIRSKERGAPGAGRESILTTRPMQHTKSNPFHDRGPPKQCSQKKIGISLTPLSLRLSNIEREADSHATQLGLDLP